MFENRNDFYLHMSTLVDLLFFLQVMPAVVNVMKEDAALVTLVKPQFEAHRSQVREKKMLLSYSFSVYFDISNNNILLYMLYLIGYCG